MTPPPTPPERPLTFTEQEMRRTGLARHHIICPEETLGGPWRIRICEYSDRLIIHAAHTFDSPDVGDVGRNTVGILSVRDDRSVYSDIDAILRTFDLTKLEYNKPVFTAYAFECVNDHRHRVWRVFYDAPLSEWPESMRTCFDL